MPTEVWYIIADINIKEKKEISVIESKYNRREGKERSDRTRLKEVIPYKYTHHAIYSR